MRLPLRLRRWLMRGSDPSVQLRVRKELLGESERSAGVRRTRRAIGRIGWAREILDLQLSQGQWDNPGTSGRQLYHPKYVATNWRLIVLADLGIPGNHPQVRRALRLVFRGESGRRGGLGGPGSEVCFTGNAARYLLKFGLRDDPRTSACLEWLLAHQKSDGGWHCWPSRTGTLDCWEALAAFAAIPEADRTSEVRAAIDRGASFYLRRRLLREGRRYAPWYRTHYPAHYYYDFLVGLDVLNQLGYGADRRLGPALDLLQSKRNRDGSWNLDAQHPDLSPEIEYQLRTPYYPFVLEPEGRPSRWITITALRVLRDAGRL